MLTKKIKTKTKTKTTRKLPPFEKLPKTRRSRILSMETYKINYLHNPFRNMILSYDKPVVVKIYDANKLDLLLERKILEKMRDYRNTVRLICEFSCDDDKNNYITKLTRGTDKLYFFAYEYISHGNISDYFKKTRDIKIVKTLILQTMEPHLFPLIVVPYFRFYIISFNWL